MEIEMHETPAGGNEGMFILYFVRFWFGNGNQNQVSEQKDKTVMIRWYLVNFGVAC